MYSDILFPFTFSLRFLREKKNDIHAMKLIYILFSLWRMWYGCSGRQGKDSTRLDSHREMGVFYNLIMRYIIPRIWAWKFHSIVENLIWYFRLFSLLLFSAFPPKPPNLESLSHPRRDGIWWVIAFLFRSVFLLYLRLQEIYSLVRRMFTGKFVLLSFSSYQPRAIFTLSVVS